MPTTLAQQFNVSERAINRGRVYEGRLQRQAREAAEAEAKRLARADVEFAAQWRACGWPDAGAP